jgi:hypothetical protein
MSNTKGGKAGKAGKGRKSGKSKNKKTFNKTKKTSKKGLSNFFNDLFSNCGCKKTKKRKTISKTRSKK